MSSIRNKYWNFWFFQKHKRSAQSLNFDCMWLVNELVLTFSAPIKCAQAQFNLIILSFFNTWQLKAMPLIKMERYTLQKRIEVVEISYKNAWKWIWISPKIIMGDEAHLHLGYYVNKQNFRIWSSESPKMIIEKPLYPQRVTVWCGFWAGGIIRPYFFWKWSLSGCFGEWIALSNHV